MQQCVRPALLLYEDPQVLFVHLIEQAKQTDEVAFTRTVGTDQHVEATQLEVTQFADRFIT